MQRSRPDWANLDAADWAGIARLLGLSERERQVVHGLFEGKTEARIAADLKISVRTVHCHLERIYRKLDVHERLGFARRVFGAYLTLLGSR
jgi:DNA-binding NarL/FixJ family response regulator